MPMDWNPIASAAGGIVGAISGAIQNKKNREFEAEQAQLQRDWSEQQTEKQNAWNLEQWQREMDYNSPTSQVQRLRDAGLNPLFYGLDGNSTGGSPTAAQPLGYERASLGALQNPVAAGLDAAARIAQVSNIQADTAKKNNENLTETQRREKLLADTANAKQQLQNMIAQEGLTESQREEIDKRISWIDRVNEAAVSEKEAAAELSKSQKKRIDELLEGEKQIQIKTLDDFDKRWKEIEAKCKLLAQQEKLAEKDILNYALNHASNGFLGTGLSFQNFIRLVKEGLTSKGPSEDEPVETSTGVAFNGQNLSEKHGMPIN